MSSRLIPLVSIRFGTDAIGLLIDGGRIGGTRNRMFSRHNGLTLLCRGGLRLSGIVLLRRRTLFHLGRIVRIHLLGRIDLHRRSRLMLRLLRRRRLNLGVDGIERRLALFARSLDTLNQIRFNKLIANLLGVRVCIDL